MAKRDVVVVDGSNVAFGEQTKQGKPQVSNLVAVRKELEQRGYEPVVIVDASLRHQIDDPDQLESLLEKQQVRQAPAGTDADFFVLQTADELEGKVVSNDTFEPYQDRFPWISDRRVPLMIVKGKVELYEQMLRPEK